MLNTQKQLVKYLNELDNILKPFDKLDYTDSITSLKEDIISRELIVPVIGGFSAGKSTAINSFIEKDVLPVGVLPETDLAAEIRFDEKERVEAIKDNGIDLFTLEEFDKIKENSSNYKFLKVYVNSNNIKSIEPLILVDMPGFESPLDKHNKAIMEYIKKGTFYIVLINVTDGTIKKEILLELQNLYNLDREFIVVLSQTNLRDEESVVEIKDNIKDILELEFDYNKEIPTIGLNAKDEFLDVLNNINPEELFKSLYLDNLKDLYFSIIENINLIINTLERKTEENYQLIEELQKSLETLDKEKKALIEDAKAKYYQKSDIIVENIIQEINTHKKQLIEKLINNNIEGFNLQIENIIRATLIKNLRESIESISLDIIKSISNKLTYSQDFISYDMMLTITDNIKNYVINGGKIIQQKLNTWSSAKDTYRKVIAVLAIVTNIITPIIEVIILILPDIIEKIFYNQKIRKLENSFDEEIIPQLKNALSYQIEEILQREIDNLIKTISEEFEAKIKEKQEVINKTMQENDKNNEKIEEEIEKYKKLQNKIKQISKVLFKEEE